MGAILHNFGDKLQYLRVQQNLTQMDLAHHLALGSHTHVSRLEAGLRAPSLDLIVRIAKFFSVTIDYLMRDSLPVEAPIPYSISVEMPANQMYFSFAAKLRYLRKKHQVTQAELAQQLALRTQAHVSLLEIGRSEPSIERVLQIADIFGVSTDYLLRAGLSIEPNTTASDHSSG